jgi:N-acetyl-anhydromuramyl-L-alanine amidase AmpD
MKIIKTFLNSDNSMVVRGSTISQRILQQNKQHLWSEREKGVVDTIVVHYISAIEAIPDNPFEMEAVLELFCEYGVSSHYLINREGVVYQLVPEEKKAWHCGGSIMPAPDEREGVNEFSIGIELMATHDSGFTEEQYDALAAICREIEKRWDIKIYTGHENIAGKNAVTLGLRREVKTDPGPLFDWEKFYTMKQLTGSSGGV